MSSRRIKTRTSIVAAVLALGMAGSAMARDDGYGHRDRRDDDGPRHSQRFDRDHDRSGHWDARDNDHRGWRRGGYLPPTYRSPYSEVGDWRARRLQAPPSGYHWVSANGDLVLAAIATGLIAKIIASH
ncbi:putative integral membrane protein [Variovorax sp. PBS-H4]|uniref:RcnB family protein n=1 Tax=Variovorax sp. PBS-H4 TaxID=434008 RepID=UPI001319AC71|nr:RcnB family protein [Variovorax sp. PBS-H4]VTU17749.1 putative integral membrane protein [Variovorax sp. PBS-H4]